VMARCGLDYRSEVVAKNALYNSGFADTGRALVRGAISVA
jgi:hypothetical protein